MYHFITYSVAFRSPFTRLCPLRRLHRLFRAVSRAAPTGCTSGTRRTGRYRLPLLLVLCGVVCLACAPLSDGSALLERDIHPPVLYDALSASAKTVDLHLSEPASLQTQSLLLSPHIPLAEAEQREGGIRLYFMEALEPGAPYSLSARVADREGNTLTFVARFYGFNPRVPQLRINELTTQGSSSNPDKVELLALAEGNTAGVALYEGTRDYWDQRKVLPPVELQAGDYLVIHCKPAGTADEVDETEDPNTCSAEEAIPGAWDFWIEGGTGLSGNNGVISLYRSARGPALDGFLYSNRSSSSDERYRGFGSSRTLERAEQLAAEGQWVVQDLLIAPEDAVDPEDSTATRSMCRTPGAEDTDSAADWHIVPTSSSSFGLPNTVEVYVP